MKKFFQNTLAFIATIVSGLALFSSTIMADNLKVALAAEPTSMDPHYQNLTINNSFATQQKVKELWQEIQKEYRNMPGQSDGCLNEKQFVEVITKLGLKIRPQKLKIMFRQFDTKGTGQIFFDDFLSVAL